MLKYYIFITLLCLFVVALIAEGLIIAGSPMSQKDIQLDSNRLEAFNNIKYQIENYYTANGKMPNSLNDLSSNVNVKDPETKMDFDYKLILPYSYNLCATFSTDNSEQVKNYPSYDSDTAIYKKHKKGYDCLEFKISDYAIGSTRVTPTTAVLSTLYVNSNPKGVTTTSIAITNTPEYGGTTDYTRTKNGVINTTIDAPTSVLIGGTSYIFSSWSGCNNDTVADQYCSVLVNGNVLTITANYSVQNLPSP